MAWVDLLLLSLLLLSVLVGLWRGLVYEVMAIAGWVVAYFACSPLAPMLLPLLPQGRLDPALMQGLSLLLAFMLVLLLWGLAAKLLRSLIHATPLSVPDRLLGAGFGVLRAVLLGLLIVLGVSMTPASRTEAWQASALAPWLQAALQGLSPMLPADMLKFISVG